LDFSFAGQAAKPVDREKNTGLVDQVAQLFNSHDEFAIGLAPEGTRKKVTELKTDSITWPEKPMSPSFPAYLIMNIRSFILCLPFYTTDDMERDLDFLWNIYRV
jgi:hypothetical protein